MPNGVHVASNSETFEHLPPLIHPNCACLDNGTVAPLYKNIGHKNKLAWKNIFSHRENFVSDLRIISYPRIFLGIINLFL